MGSRDGSLRCSVSGALDLSKGLVNNHSLCHLDLGYNGFEDEELAVLCSAFEKMPQLEFLSLAGNNCQRLGTRGISGVLMNHSLLRPPLGIRRIDLSSNPLLNQVSQLTQGLTVSESLLHLDLRNCSLSDHDAEQLLSAMQLNFTITSLNLSGNAISLELNCALNAEIEGNNLLLQITQNPFDCDADSLNAAVKLKLSNDSLSPIFRHTAL